MVYIPGLFDLERKNNVEMPEKNTFNLKKKGMLYNQSRENRVLQTHRNTKPTRSNIKNVLENKKIYTILIVISKDRSWNFIVKA